MDMKLFKQHLNHLTELRIKNGGDEWDQRAVQDKLFRFLQGQGGSKGSGSSRPGSDSGEPKPSKPKNPKPKKPGRDN